MKYTAVKIAAKDNVATVLQNIAAGETVTYSDDGTPKEIVAREDIPVYHKIALSPLPKGGQVFKYGESLGILTADVPAGMWVSHLVLESLPRDYGSELSETK